MAQVDVERSQEFRKCIECFLCQDVCHVIRDHEDNKEAFAGPRFLMRIAELDMHPLDALDRKDARAGRARPRLLQHHQVLHRGLPRAHQDHRQRADPDEGARRRPQVRPAGLARAARSPGAGSRSRSTIAGGTYLGTGDAVSAINGGADRQYDLVGVRSLAESHIRTLREHTRGRKVTEGRCGHRKSAGHRAPGRSRLRGRLAASHPSPVERMDGEYDPCRGH